MSLLISVFIPGAGSMVNGDVGPGVLILVGYFISLILVFVFIGVLLAPIVWIIGIVHAFNGAKRWNASHGIIS